MNGNDIRDIFQQLNNVIILIHVCDKQIKYVYYRETILTKIIFYDI